MKLEILDLIGKSPAQLSKIKNDLSSAFRFHDASTVQEYIDHCISMGRLVKKILRG